MRLLVCDLTPATPALSPEVASALQADGFELDTVTTMDEAIWRASESSYAALLVTTGTTGTAHDGHIVAVESLRGAGLTTPIIVITSDDDPHDESTALDAGADDHLRAPVAPGLLVARLRAHRRRTESGPATTLTVGRFTLDASRLAATAPDGTQIDLTRREFAVVELLARRAPDPVDKLAILDAVWGFDFDGDPNVVEVYVGYLRKKLGRSAIRTVRGVGYHAAEA